jgi:hypothetical protein
LPTSSKVNSDCQLTSNGWLEILSKTSDSFNPSNSIYSFLP